MAKAFTVKDFFQMFPDDGACLDHLMRLRFGEGLTCPKCGKEGRFARIAKIPAYSCAWCGHHIHPMVGTPFEDSSTPLQKWFYAMYLFTTTRHGVPAKELQRQLSVTYKTAWRMGHKIREYMAKVDGDTPLSGHVEADETYVGGRHAGKTGRGAAGKTVVFGMLERGANVMTRVVPDAKRKTLEPHLIEKIERGSLVSTDEYVGYDNLTKLGYDHQRVNHRKHEYVRGIIHTNGLEGFWSMLKRAIRGTHVHVSRRHLAKYLGEFEFRYNRRKNPRVMFPALLSGF
ncbi:MAG: IS1595 family transposase [Alphaproteobacteria bacterium]|nr:IS1595 family transposase [Alphaproteobacteria bacterium]